MISTMHGKTNNIINVTLRKMATLSSIIAAWLLYPFFFLLLIFMRILRSAVYIRLVRLESGRIGHLAANTEIYLCERELGIHGKRLVDIFYHTPDVCNRQLKMMWDRILDVSPLAGFVLDRIKQFLPAAEEHIFHMSGVSSDLDLYYLLGRTNPHLNFTWREEKKGTEGLLKLGVPANAPFICFYSRDPSYLHAVQPAMDWSYQDYRNAHISDYLRAAEALAGRGYYLIRMGSHVEERLKTDNPKIIDYVAGKRSDFLDIFLCSNCKFFISSTGGLNAVPRIFRRPVVYVNFIPIGSKHLYLCTPQGVVIPKKIWSRDKGRILTFHELIDMYAFSFYRSMDYDRAGLKVIDNTAGEIAAVALEMDDRLKDRWRGTAEDEELQKRFWSIFRPEESHNIDRPWIGADFLRKNRELLE